jgi:ribosomal protein S18 acetylase RimI-like enzyme
LVELIPMSKDEFHEYLGPAIAGYAEELVRAGNTPPGQALSSAEAQFDSLLPDGLDTPDQHLFSIWDRDRRVGALWFGVRDDGDRPFAALYDFLIFEVYRRQGYGQQALLALDQQVKALGFDTIRLHVFGHNRAARALYEKMGYVATNVTMTKRLEE